MEQGGSLLMKAKKDKLRLFAFTTAVALGCASCTSGGVLKQALSHDDAVSWVYFAELYNSPTQPVVVCDSDFTEILTRKLGVNVPTFTTGEENLLVIPGITVEKYSLTQIDLCSAPKLRPAGMLRDVPQRFERTGSTWRLDSSETEKLDLYN